MPAPLATVYAPAAQPDQPCAVLFCFLLRADDEGMGNRIHADEDVIGFPELVGKAALFQWNCSGRDVVLRAKFAVGAPHTFVASDDNRAHIALLNM